MQLLDVEAVKLCGMLASPHQRPKESQATA
jgi:hypothetical protein